MHLEFAEDDAHMGLNGHVFMEGGVIDRDRESLYVCENNISICVYIYIYTCLRMLTSTPFLAV